MDLDWECLQEFEHWLPDDVPLVVPKRGNHLTNSLLASAAGHPFWYVHVALDSDRQSPRAAPREHVIDTARSS